MQIYNFFVLLMIVCFGDIYNQIHVFIIHVLLHLTCFNMANEGVNIVKNEKIYSNN